MNSKPIGGLNGSKRAVSSPPPLHAYMSTEVQTCSKMNRVAGLETRGSKLDVLISLIDMVRYTNEITAQGLTVTREAQVRES